MNLTKSLTFLFFCSSLLFCGGTSFIKTENIVPLSTEESLILTKVESSKDISVYRYINPYINDYSFSSVLLDPIIINQEKFDPKIIPIIDKLKSSILDSFKKKLDQNSISESEDEDKSEKTARISLSLTSLKIKPEGLKPWNLLPLSALVTATVYVAGYNTKSLDLHLECKITHSETNELITKDLIILSSDKFRNKNRTLEIFSSLGNKALDQIFMGSLLPVVLKK